MRPRAEVPVESNESPSSRELQDGQLQQISTTGQVTGQPGRQKLITLADHEQIQAAETEVVRIAISARTQGLQQLRQEQRGSQPPPRQQQHPN